MRTTIRPATLQREYNQGYIFYFPNTCMCVCVCMRVPITFAGMVTQFIFMSILTMYFLFAHRFYAQFNSPRVHKLTIYQFRISTKTNIRYGPRGQSLRIVSKHVCWSTINVQILDTVLIYPIILCACFHN